MGKQRQQKNTGSTRTPSVNSINWEHRARELVILGVCSPMILDTGNHATAGRKPR